MSAIPLLEKVLKEAGDPEKVSRAFEDFITKACKAMGTSQKADYDKFMETNLAHKYPSLTPEEVSRAVSVCAVESVGRVSASPYPDLPGVMDTWFLQCLRCNKMHPGSFLVLLSGLYALEKFGTTGHERTPPDYLQAFQDLINGRGVILDSFTEIYSVVASTVLRNAPGSTFRYIHPDFTSSVEIPENERQRIWEYLRNEMLEMETCEEDLCRRSRGLAVE